MRNGRCLGWTGLIWLLGVGVAAAQAPQGKGFTEPFKLGEVVVSKAGSGVEAVGTIQVLTAEDIKVKGARTLDEALDLIPGLEISTGNAGTPRVNIRGLRTRQVLLLLDGVPLSNTYDGQFDPTTIPVDYIARIKVTKGGSSLLYGPGGNAGVINIITKKGRDGLGGELAGEVGEGGAYLGRASLGGGSRDLSGFVSASTRNRDEYLLSDDFQPTAYQPGDTRENSDLRRDNIFANLSQAVSEETNWGLTANYLSGDNGVPPTTNYDKSDPFSKKPKYDRTDDLEGYTLQAAFSHLPGAFGVRGWAYVNSLDTLDNRYDDDTYATQDKNGAYRSDGTSRVVGANLQLGYDFDRYGLATLALMGQSDSWDASGFTVESVKKQDVKRDFSQDKDTQTYTAALEYEVSPVDRLGLVLGYGQHFFRADDAENDNDYSVLAGAYYDIAPKSRVRLSFERKVRFPSIRQLYDVDGGNPDLKAERTYTYEAGWEQGLPGATQLELTAYRINAKDFIEKSGAGTFENYEDYRFQGFEIGLANNYWQALMLRLSYAYLDSEDQSAGSGRDELQYRPRDMFALEAVYRFACGFTAYGSVLYVANQYFYTDKPPLEKKKLNSYTVVNLKLSQAFWQDRVEVYARAENLFDEDYEQSYGLPQPGRTLFGGVTLRF